MSIRFAPTASRHGISNPRAKFVVETCPMPLYSGEVGEEDLVIFLGPDENGVPLEVVGVELTRDDLLVIHAMRLRPKYAADFARVMKAKKP